jgi:hypothetical protein
MKNEKGKERKVGKETAKKEMGSKGRENGRSICDERYFVSRKTYASV